MLKQRVIGVVLVNASGIAVQSVGFKRYLPIGSPQIAINYLDRWGIDEIVVLHIDAYQNSKTPSKEIIETYAKECRVPLAVGGGIKSVEDIQQIIAAGADKVVINTSFHDQPELILNAAEIFGSQAIIVSFDASFRDGGFFIYKHTASTLTALRLESQIKQAIDLKAGEIFLNSVDKDGSKKGFDLNLIKSLPKKCSVPVTLCGGAGLPEHISSAMSFDLSGVAAANFWHFSEHSVNTVKHELVSRDKAIRFDSHVKYAGFNHDSDGRVKRLKEQYLDDLRFVYVAEEKI